MRNSIGRYTLIFVLALFSFSCNTKEKRKEGQESSRLDFAESISDKILSAQKRGGFYKLSAEEAISEMVEGLDEDLQKSSYKTIKAAFGDYKELKLDTVLELKQDKIYQVYRFKGDFELSNNVEVRTVLNANGKLAGFFVLPWKTGL